MSVTKKRRKYRIKMILKSALKSSDTVMKDDKKNWEQIYYELFNCIEQHAIYYYLI